MGGWFTVLKIGNNCHFRQTCSITVSTKIFRSRHKIPFSQAISYTFLDKHFLPANRKRVFGGVIERIVYFYYSFFDALRTLSFKNRTFQKSAPISPLFSPILSTTRFCFTPFHADSTLKNPSNSLYFSRPHLQFHTISRNTICNISRSTILTISTLTNPSKSIVTLSTFALNYSQKNA